MPAPSATSAYGCRPDLRGNIERLRKLSAQAFLPGKELDDEDRKVQFERRETLAVLSRSFANLALAIDAVQPMPPGANAQQAWDALTTVFELSEGRNLRELIAAGSHRARASEAHERSAADRTLRWMRGPWLGTAAALALAALRRIVNTTRQLGLVIEDLLTMARSDIDALALQRVPIDTVPALRDSIEPCAPQASAAGVQIDASLGQASEPCLLADAQRLRQLLSIRLDNALRYAHPQGRVSASPQVMADEQGRRHGEVRVTDQGIGIPADELPRIFERNFRGASARLHRQACTVPTARAAARPLLRPWHAHGGSIALESEAGRGTWPGFACRCRVNPPG